MPGRASGRVTQQAIAEMVGVSQATVSLVLNGRSDGGVRIPDETRRRVLEAIRRTTYVANPAARRLAGVGNRIIGVFTYEPAFPSTSLDFYTPLLLGIERAAEGLGADLLMFTSAPVVDGRRRVCHENNRLGLADGCLLLGQRMDEEDLARLVAEGYPFVAVGRRQVEGVPYVGIDYATATATLVRRALEFGHERFFYFHGIVGAESAADRRRGFLEPLAEAEGVSYDFLENDWQNPTADRDAILAARPSVVFLQHPDRAVLLWNLLQEAGMRIPQDLSLVVLNDTSGRQSGGVDFTRLRPPRVALGYTATNLLAKMLSGEVLQQTEQRTLLECPTVEGNTLSCPTRRAE